MDQVQTVSAPSTGKKFEFLTKADTEDKGKYVFGPALIPDEVDSQGDVVSREEIEKIAFGFMTDFQNVGDSHEKIIPRGDATFVESYLSKTEMEFDGEVFPVGTWFLGTKVYDPDTIEKINSGEFNAYSIGGTGERIPVGGE